MPIATSPGKTLLAPNDHILVMVDYQSRMAFATKSIDAVALRNNAALIAGGRAGLRGSASINHRYGKIISGTIFLTN